MYCRHLLVYKENSYMAFIGLPKFLFKVSIWKWFWWHLCILLIRYHVFYDRMTVHRNRFLVNKTNRCTQFQFFWYYYSTCFGQLFCPSSGVLSCTSALVHFMQLWLHKMCQGRRTAKNSRWWAERLPETCTVVIPIKLEFSASVGFIHKEFTWIDKLTDLNC
jgi:hypothetical protein